MAVTLTEEDFIHPAGELRTSFFPQGDLATNLATWLTEVNSEVDHLDTLAEQNSAREHWIYWRAFSDIADRMAQLPTSSSYYGDVSRTYDQRNIAHWRKRAQEHYDMFLQRANPKTTRTVRGASNFARNRNVF